MALSETGRRVCEAELVENERMYESARARAIDPDTIDRLITAHRALYELRMEGKLVTNYIRCDVAQALDSISGALRPYTMIDTGLYREEG